MKPIAKPAFLIKNKEFREEGGCSLLKKRLFKTFKRIARIRNGGFSEGQEVSL